MQMKENLMFFEDLSAKLIQFGLRTLLGRYLPPGGYFPHIWRHFQASFHLEYWKITKNFTFHGEIFDNFEFIAFSTASALTFSLPLNFPQLKFKIAYKQPEFAPRSLEKTRKMHAESDFSVNKNLFWFLLVNRSNVRDVTANRTARQGGKI